MKTIGLISISDNADIEKLESEAFQNLVDVFEQRGYRFVFGSCLRKNIHETTPKERADQINDFFADPAIDIVWPIDGGAFANETLPYIDFEMIKKHPKPFLGFSDTTVVSNVLFLESGLVNYSAPTFGMLRHYWFERERMHAQIFDLLERWYSSQQLWDLRKFVDYSCISDANPDGIIEDGWLCVLASGEASGTLLGGNLGTFVLLFGTKWQPDLTDVILFLEECGENSIGEIRRLLVQIRQQPTANGLRGIVFGKINTSCYREYEIDLHKTLVEVFGDLNIPIISEAGFGHIYPFQILPVGGKCRIDTHKCSFEIDV